MTKLSAYSPDRLKEARSWREASENDRLKLQLNFLRDHLAQAAKSDFYGALFRRMNFSPQKLESLASFSQLPLTSKKDLEKNPAAFYATAKEQQIDIALTSGTTGVPVAIPYTARDLQRLAFNEAINFWRTGISSRDRYLLCVTLDRCFVAGLAYYSGLVMLGASVIRGGSGSPASHWELIRQLKPNGIIGVPSFLLTLAKWGEAQGHLQDASITSLVTIGEPVRQADHTPTLLGKELQEIWNAEVFSSYGATEMQTAFGDCPAHNGAHIHPEMMMVEIIDDDGNVLPPGLPGEVVVTPLGVEGLPLVRFRTGDVARFHEGGCKCGWNTPRLGAVEGRLAQRLKFRGTTLYPEMIFHVLHEHALAEAAYVEVRMNHDLSDEVVVVVGSDDSSVSISHIEDILQARLRVKPKIMLEAKNRVLQKMDAGGHKKKKFYDFRRDIK